MRKFEHITEYEHLPDVARIIHELNFVFEADSYNEDSVLITIRYDKSQEDQLSDLEENLNAYERKQEDADEDEEDTDD
ncbi:MAG: hypothetical protein U1O81_07865 [Planktothrix rubescens PR223]|jgi:putative IMPACT (imprinted ancient) family translation regulator